MSELAEAAGGALAVIGGGYLFLLLAGAMGTQSVVNLSLWGAILVAVGFFLLVAVIAAAVGAVLGELQ